MGRLVNLSTHASPEWGATVEIHLHSALLVSISYNQSYIPYVKKNYMLQESGS
jgi:hypothetical protein